MPPWKNVTLRSHVPYCSCTSAFVKRIPPNRQLPSFCSCYDNRRQRRKTADNACFVQNPCNTSVLPSVLGTRIDTHLWLPQSCPWTETESTALSASEGPREQFPLGLAKMCFVAMIGCVCKARRAEGLGFSCRQNHTTVRRGGSPDETRPVRATDPAWAVAEDQNRGLASEHSAFLRPTY